MKEIVNLKFYDFQQFIIINYNMKNSISRFSINSISDKKSYRSNPTSRNKSNSRQKTLQNKIQLMLMNQKGKQQMLDGTSKNKIKFQRKQQRSGKENNDVNRNNCYFENAQDVQNVETRRITLKHYLTDTPNQEYVGISKVQESIILKQIRELKSTVHKYIKKNQPNFQLNKTHNMLGFGKPFNF